MSPEYDAFGRPIRGGSSGDGAAPRSAEPASHPGWSPAPQGDGRSSSGDARAEARAEAERRSRARRSGGGREPSRSGNGSGCVGPFIGVVVTIAVGLGPVIAIFSDGDDSSSGTRFATPGKALTSKDSLVSPTGLRDGMRRLKAELRPGERISTLSIRAEYLSATVATGVDAPRRFITIRGGDDVFTSSSGTSTERGVSFEALDPEAPSRLIAAALRGTSGSGFGSSDYVVLSTGRDPGDPVTWAVYLQGRERWTSDAKGAHVIRPEDGAPAPAVGERGPAKAPTGITGTSMVRSANLRRAIAAVRPRVPANSLVTGVDVRPASVTVTVRRSFHERRWAVDAAFGVTPQSESETTQRNGIPFGAVDAMGPERAVRRIESRAKNRASSRVDYVVLSLRQPVFADSRTTWGVFLKDGSPARRYWRASLDGRRVGEPGKPGSP
ncbi:hypothetical protein [Patulibacter minatonensis]|uniref:hypothetical protein n=1 Tax=Patulibacter minatonensis TaxID=298163 RepID=UPI00047E47B4|nr:hypothetical protein [Patulibacter minatonensis]